MRTEAVTADMLPALREWWAGRDLGTLPDDVLPPVGFVASDDHGPAAAAWLYQPAGCRVAIIDWLVTRPGLSLLDGRAACRAVFAALEARADSDGATRIFATVARPGMLREARACGFQVAAVAMTHLVKNL